MLRQEITYAAQEHSDHVPAAVDTRMLACVWKYVPQSTDVSEAADRAWFDGIRELTPLQRLQIADRASRDLHRLSVAGLRLRFPQASAEELERRAGALRLGPELTRMAFGQLAEAWLE